MSMKRFSSAKHVLKKKTIKLIRLSFWSPMPFIRFSYAAYQLFQKEKKMNNKPLAKIRDEENEFRIYLRETKRNIYYILKRCQIIN